MLKTRLLTSITILSLNDFLTVDALQATPTQMFYFPSDKLIIFTPSYTALICCRKLYMNKFDALNEIIIEIYFN